MMHRERIRSLSDAFDYYTDCAIAMYEVLMSRKSASSSDQRRARDIALGMLEAFKRYGGPPEAVADLGERLKAADLVVP
jgi:hypothetical protein